MLPVVLSHPSIRYGARLGDIIDEQQHDANSSSVLSQLTGNKETTQATHQVGSNSKRKEDARFTLFPCGGPFVHFQSFLTLRLCLWLSLCAGITGAGVSL